MNQLAALDRPRVAGDMIGPSIYCMLSILTVRFCRLTLFQCVLEILLDMWSSFYKQVLNIVEKQCSLFRQMDWRSIR